MAAQERFVRLVGKRCRYTEEGGDILVDVVCVHATPARKGCDEGTEVVVRAVGPGSAPFDDMKAGQEWSVWVTNGDGQGYCPWYLRELPL